MEVGHGILRKRDTVDDTESRSSRRRRKLEDTNLNNQFNYPQLPPITSEVAVEYSSDNFAASSCWSELKHGELRSNYEQKNVSKEDETENSSTEISKPLIRDNKRMKHMMKRSKSSSISNSPSTKMPPMEEIESFFSTSEKYEQKRFSEKYNYDVVKDVPMEEGRYEWIQIKP